MTPWPGPTCKDEKDVSKTLPFTYVAHASFFQTMSIYFVDPFPDRFIVTQAGQSLCFSGARTLPWLYIFVGYARLRCSCTFHACLNSECSQLLIVATGEIWTTYPILIALPWLHPCVNDKTHAALALTLAGCLRDFVKCRSSASEPLMLQVQNLDQNLALTQAANRGLTRSLQERFGTEGVEWWLLVVMDHSPIPTKHQ